MKIGSHCFFIGLADKLDGISIASQIDEPVVDVNQGIDAVSNLVSSFRKI